MSNIIVRGMEMPENCAQCDAEWEDENPFGETETYCCPFIYKGYTDDFRNQRRHKDCPLFEVKDWREI